MTAHPGAGAAAGERRHAAPRALAGPDRLHRGVEASGGRPGDGAAANNCRGPGGMRRRGGVTLYGERKRFRFRAADAAAERDGSSWLRSAT